jgi:hypothetical protein
MKTNTITEAAALIVALKGRGLLSPRCFLAAARQTSWGADMDVELLASLYGDALGHLAIGGIITLPEAVAATLG